MRNCSIVLAWLIVIQYRVKDLPSPVDRDRILGSFNWVNTLWNRGDILKAIRRMNRVEAEIDYLWDLVRRIQKQNVEEEQAIDDWLRGVE